MYYFKIRRTMIVMIFYNIVSCNILTQNSSGIKNKERGSHFRHRRFRLHHETKFLEKQLLYSSGHAGLFSPKCNHKRRNSGGKAKIYDYFGSKSKKESELEPVAVPNNKLQVEIVVRKAVAVCQPASDIHANCVGIIQVQSPNQPRGHSFPKRTFGKTSKKECCFAIKLS